MQYAAADLLGDDTLFFAGGGNLLVHPEDLRHAAADGFQLAAAVATRLDAVAGQFAAVVEHARDLLGPTLQSHDQVLDLLCRVLGALSQAAHLVGDHGEATAGLAGPGRLDGGIQGQQVGLLGHRLDHVEHAADPLAFALEPAHGLGAALHMLLELFDLFDGIGHGAVTFAGLLVGLGGRHGGGFGVTSDFEHTGAHLFHGGGHLLGGGVLAADAGIGLFGTGRQVFGGAGHPRSADADATDQLPQAEGHAAHGLLQLA